MGTITKFLLAGCVVFGFHYAVKWGVATVVTAQLGDQPQSPTITVDPEALHRALAVGRTVDTTAARQTVDGIASRIEQMNRTMPPPLPPAFSGIPHR
jgi:hypothetical protein